MCSFPLGAGAIDTVRVIYIVVLAFRHILNMLMVDKLPFHTAIAIPFSYSASSNSSSQPPRLRVNNTVDHDLVTPVWYLLSCCLTCEHLHDTFFKVFLLLALYVCSRSPGRSTNARGHRKGRDA